MEESANNTGHAWGYLTQPEVRFLDAAVARLIPADELGPGAKEAGVSVFIDRQLCSNWGMLSRAYRMGPWPEGTPQQGFQCPLTPQEIYRQAIREINAHCVQHHHKPFPQLTTEQQEAILKDLEADRFVMEALRAKVFFDMLLKNTMEGFFSDPIHGGNRDKVGWRLVGFPGVASSTYPSRMDPEMDNVPYLVEPVSILDIEQNRAKLDAQGYPVHIVIKGGN
jgi:gluconate 2-dehydrogenase gamma chain